MKYFDVNKISICNISAILNVGTVQLSVFLLIPEFNETDK